MNSVSPLRSLSDIASDISREWKRPYFGAVPYIEALHCLNSVSDTYGVESARDLVERFLVNAQTFRGPRAKELKAELKAHLGRKK